MKILFFTAALTSSTALFGGSISGGGGEFLGDSRNPWFVTAQAGETSSAPIRYCIEKGPDFDSSYDELTKIVQGSISWWNTQMSNAHIPENKISVASINAIVKPYIYPSTLSPNCDEKTDLRFQFGILTPDQQKDLEQEKIDPRKFVGMTIRTDYDPSLRGKGYIYISPDHGPLGMNGANVRPNAWKDGRGLKEVVRHELGHVLGVPHTSSGLMDARGPEHAVSSDYSDLIWSGWKDTPVFFPGPFKFQTCEKPSNLTLYKFFNLPLDHQCINVQIDLNKLSIASKKSRRDEDQPLHEVEFTADNRKRFKDLVTLTSLPTNRTVFKKVPDFIHTLNGPQITEILQEASFKIDGQTVNLIIQRDPEHVQISGFKDGVLIPDLIPDTSGWK